MHKTPNWNRKIEARWDAKVNLASVFIRKIMHAISQHLMRLPLKTQHQILANAVDETIRKVFPAKYMGLCHMYAVVGSNLLSIVYNRNYIPIAGIALIDTGKGELLKMLDNNAFTREKGGAYHCWIESIEGTDSEMVDLIYRHNETYAVAHGVKWNRRRSCSYLWGIKSEICLQVEDDVEPTTLPEGKVWFKATADGKAWLTSHLSEFGQQYAKLTLMTLKRVQHELQGKLKITND